ncbi:MAG: hypothetical protein WBC44_18845 [Planctomycetaceae bacterium]
MSKLFVKGTFLLAAGCSGGLFAGDLPEELLYMLPLPSLESIESLPQIAGVVPHETQRPVVPVEAPRPAPAVEIVTTPVGEFNISCSFVIPASGDLSPAAVPVLAMQPVEARRPAN